MRVSVVIPHLRGREILGDVLTDLQREIELVGDCEVIVVDNASSDGSRELVEEEFPWVRLIRLERNQGYAGGCNRGIEAARGEWTWLLNDDVRIDPGAIEQMLEVAESAEDIAAVQPKLIYLREPGRFDYAGGAGGMIDIFGYPFALGRIGGEMERDTGQYDIPREIFWASGTACLWRRSALQEIGLLDESFFAHMEEIDLAWRAWNCGWRVYSAPGAVVRHLGGGTLSYQAWRKMFLNHRNALFTLVKNRETGSLLWLLPVRLLMDNAIGLAEAASGRPGRLTAVWAGWLAFLAGFRTWTRKRRTAQGKRVRRDRELSRVVYQGSILLAFARGARSTGSLAI